MKSYIKKIFWLIWKKIIPIYTYEKELKKLLNEINCKKVLDIGCGINSPLARCELSFKTSIGVDINFQALKKSKVNKNHHHYFLINAVKVQNVFYKQKFDAIVCSDLIEHLNKKKGLELLNIGEKIKCKRVIFLTPNGFLKQAGTKENPYQKHISKWTIKDFTAKGYKVIGLNGLKFLRGEKAQIKFKPLWLWTLIDHIFHIVVRYFPQYAFHILAYKDFEREDIP